MSAVGGMQRIAAGAAPLHLLQSRLLSALFFLGPCGMFFLPLPGVGSLRSFYFVTALINVVALMSLRLRHLVQHGIIGLIAFIAACSAFYAYGSFDAEQGLALNPMVRFVVLLNLLWGFYNAATWLAGRPADDLQRLLLVSYKGFLAVFLCGGLLYILYVTGASALYSRFVSLEQEAYGYIRFSPGTYPNEFGIICSFYGVLSISLYGHTSKPRYLAFFLLAMAGMFLASTRAAYITAAVGLLTVFIRFPDPQARVQMLLFSAGSAPLLMLVLSYFSFDLIGVLQAGYEALASGRGSSGERALDWTRALREFSDSYLFGSGFESQAASQLHNVPLQFLHGLGLLPLFAITVLAVLFFWLQHASGAVTLNTGSERLRRHLSLIRWILFQHVFIFALTNHNQAHFFTWLLFAMACMKFECRGDLAMKVNGNCTKLEDKAA